MTETDWLLHRSPAELATELSIVSRGQPLYLLAAAVLRRVWDLLPSGSWRRAVEATERFARGLTTQRDFHESWVNAEADTADVPFSEYRWGCPCCDGPSFGIDDEIFGHVQPAIDRMLRRPATFAAECAFAALRALVDARLCCDNDERWLAERRAQLDLYLDLATAPPGRMAGARLVRSSPALARLVGALDRQGDLTRFDLLALGDALEEEGCRDEALLRHCRTTRPHFRGCWVLEHLTGRANRPMPGDGRRIVPGAEVPGAPAPGY